MSNFFLSSQDSSNKSLGELIKRIRKTNNLTQAAFGQLFEPSVTQSTIARWEKGTQTPDKIHFPKIASLLSISDDELLEIIEEPLLCANDLDIEIENKTLNHNKRHLAMLKKGVRAWNKWRERNPHIIPQLSGIDIYLGKYSNLDGYNFNDANLAGFKGTVVSFDRASLRRANLEKANFKESGFEEADLTGANLKQVDINSCSFDRAILRNANLSEASIKYSTLIQTDWEGSEINRAKFVDLNLSKAILKKVKISDTKLININFKEANFNETSLYKTILHKCSIYGASFLETNLNNIENKGIYVSPEGNKGLPINDLTLSSLIYLQRYNRPKIKRFIDKFYLEEEIIELGSTLCDKYGNYSPKYDFHVFNNANQTDSSPPFINVRREKNSFFIEFRPDYSDTKLILSGKAKAKTILQVVDDIIESDFEYDDVVHLREVVAFNQEMQNNRVNQFVQLALKILELRNKNKVFSKDYILERLNQEIVFCTNCDSDSKIELARIENRKEQWKIIRSSLKDSHISILQKSVARIQNEL